MLTWSEARAAFLEALRITTIAEAIVLLTLPFAIYFACGGIGDYLRGLQ